MWGGLAYVDQLVLRDRDTDANGSVDERLYGLQDANFNLTSVMSTAGAAVGRYTYTPYGARSIFDASWGTRSSSSYLWDVGHQGLFHDSETGLIYNRARFLHPNLGRFMQRDPLGYVDGMNVYEYGENKRDNPELLERVRKSGLSRLSGWPSNVMAKGGMALTSTKPTWFVSDSWNVVAGGFGEFVVGHSTVTLTRQWSHFGNFLRLLRFGPNEMTARKGGARQCRIKHTPDENP